MNIPHPKLVRCSALLLGVVFVSQTFLSAMPNHLIYFGTYTRTPSTGKGIYSVRLDDDTGALSTPTLVAEAVNPAWITLSPDKKHLYTISATKAQAAAYSVDATTSKLTPLAAATSPEAAPPSHLVVDATGRLLLAANYADGYLSAIPIHPDGSLGAPTVTRHSGHSVHPTRQDKPHVHSVTLSPDNRYVIVCDLGLDKIFTYAIDPAAAKATPANPAFVAAETGAGPRHFKFGQDGRHAYAINELGSTITTYDYDAAHGALSPRQTVPTIPPGFTDATTAAEIRVHPSGKFVYGSNRGHNSIAVFAINPVDGRLTSVEIVPSGGKVPRNFAFSPNGKWLVCAHQDSDNLTVFRVDSATGRLTPTGNTAKVSMAVCVLFYD